MPSPTRALLLVAAMGAGLCACHGEPAPPAAKPVPPSESQEHAAATGTVRLPPEQITRLGIVSSPVRPMQYTAEVAGFGIVESHDAIAQAAADWVTAQATQRLSHSALVRAQKLSGTPGAVSADVEETAAQKDEIDSMALTLATQRLSATFGMNPPWKTGGGNRTLTALAGGTIKLVRATFPLGAVTGTPHTLRAQRIATGAQDAGWMLSTIWDAPSDGAVPGRSFFALLPGGGASEGERLQVYAAAAGAESGVMIPAAAAILSGGKYWCYVQNEPGTFVRTAIDTDKPTPEGYFVARGVDAAARVVTGSAGQLLAVESGSSAEPD